MIPHNTYLIWCIIGLFCIALLKPNYSVSANNEDETDEPIVDEFKGTTKGTDDDVIEREKESIKLDGLSAAEFDELTKKAEKHDFDADVSRVMKLIINSIYRNKEIFLRELISNSADALNKVRVESLTNPSVLSTNEDLAIYVKADKNNHVLHIIDTGIGMTKKDLETNLGTIAKSGTSEFVTRLSESTEQQKQDFIGQFGVGFYSSFLVADNVIVTTKHNDDDQYIWMSDSNSFSVAKDPNGNTLKRGTQISLFLKEEAYDFLEPDTLKKLIQKYSQFVGHKIYLWQSKTETVEEPVEETKEQTSEDGAVEEEEKKEKTEPSTKTTWEYQHINSAKPIWTRKSSEVTEEEYNDFYKSISKSNEDPLAHVHFSAEGEVTFKALLHIPKNLPSNSFQEYGKTYDNIKLFVRRIFITDDFQDMLPKYLSFIRGVVDSDDLPLNVSRETLQQNKLLKVIKKKLVRKVLDMLKKLSPELFDKFWKEYSTNIKLGIMEDPSNRNRLAKLLRFYSSNDSNNQTSLSGYVERMKEKQDSIYYIAGSSRKEVENSPFVERLIKKGYEVIFLIEPVDEYCIQSLPEFDGKKFQNVAKEGLNLDENEKAKETLESLQKIYQPLLSWLKEKALAGKIEKAVVSQRLANSPSALVAPAHGWSGNMERIMKSQAYSKSSDPTLDYYSSQKKTYEINPRHPIIKELLRRVEQDSEDETALNNAKILYHTAVLRSGFSIQDQVDFAKSIESIVLKNLNLSSDEQVEEEEEENEDETASNEDQENNDSEKPVEVEEKHTEL